MSSGRVALFAVLGVLIVGLLWGMGAYNSLVGLDENAQTAQADIEVQYQRRFDLIPNLVGSVEGIFEQEREVFGQLAEARTRYSGSAAGSEERIGAIASVESALSRLLVVVENYPELRSSESVQKLQDQLEGTENRIQVARNNYNAVVNELNKKIRRFPSNIIAGIFNFDPRPRFEASDDAANTVPEVDFNN
ncbi:LemA family protein [Candidatus Peregrinibacteria bacterium CG11_big_fil_rev_8_21_14_0_20_46_8]|nr:MAG: LemA family protein [Candidatus Peregrinibacteria bacterium CG11_big_fil_rev_8_21_14_0_20_46_8]